MGFISEADMQERQEDDQYKENLIQEFKDDIVDKDELIQELLECIASLESKLVQTELSLQNALNFIEILRQQSQGAPNALPNQG